MRRLINAIRQSRSAKSTSLRLLFGASAVTLLVCTLLYRIFYSQLSAPLHDRLQVSLSEAERTIIRMLGNIQDEARWLANNADLHAYLNEDGSFAEAEERFMSFANAMNEYDQIRWIDAIGYEKIRIDRRGDDVTLAPTDRLQMKADRYYVMEGMRLEKDEIYFSPMDLNVEYGAIETPHKPVVRAVAPVIDATGIKQGMVVLNYKADAILQSIIEIAERNQLELTLLNKEGDWLIAPPGEKPWGFMFGKTTDRLSVKDAETWLQLTLDDHHRFENDRGLWSFSTLRLNPSSQRDHLWKLVGRIDPDQVLPVVYRASLMAIGLGLIMLFSMLFIIRSVVLTLLQRDEALQEVRQRKQDIEKANLDLKNTVQRLQETQDELVEAGRLSSLGLMVAGVAHELNTPVGAALIALTSLQEDGDQLDQAVKNGLKRSDLDRFLERFPDGLELVQGNLQRAADLIMRFKRLAADRSTEDRRQFDLKSLVDDLLKTTCMPLRKLGHRIEVDIPQELQLESYPGALGQVLENLLTNAVTHGFKNEWIGTIKISCRAERNQEHVLISVADNGRGISADVLPRIFDPFFTTRRGDGGTGLGLHLVHQLTKRLLGGGIRVHSIPAKGTRFTIYFPRIAPHAEHGAQDVRERLRAAAEKVASKQSAA